MCGKVHLLRLNDVTERV